MSRFTVEDTELAGLKRVTRHAMSDQRGWFERLYCSDELAAMTGLQLTPVQINRSLTLRLGAVRGLHFQIPPHAEIKLVSCLRGEAFDVAVDLRAGSPTFLRWYGTRLSAENRSSLLIPQGFAHGFQALSDQVELLYLHSVAFAQESEGGVHVCDPRLGIAWPLPVGELSARDAAHAPLDADYRGLRL